MKKLLKRARVRTLASVIAMAFAVQAWAIDPFNVRDIRIEGLQRVEPGTVFASLPFRVGDQYNDEKGSAAIRALFGLGLFTDVRLEVQGDVLVVIVEERPTISQVSFVGAREFERDADSPPSVAWRQTAPGGCGGSRPHVRPRPPADCCQRYRARCRHHRRFRSPAREFGM